MEAGQESPIFEFDDSDKDLEASPGAASLQTSHTSEISTPRLIYDRDFLLQLQNSQLSMQKPEYLPNIPEISPYKPVSTPSMDMRSGAGKYRDLPDFTPGFLRPSRGVSDGQGSATGTKVEQSKSTDHSESSLTPENSSERPDETMKQTIRPTPDTGTHLSYQRKFSALPLRQCEIDPERVAQVLTHLKRPDGQRYEVDEIPGPTSPTTEATQEREEELYRKIRSILNKLTPQKFQTLIKQVQGLVIDTETRLKGVTDIIWEQATSSSAYAPLYADLCKHLLTMKVPSGKNPEERVTLRVVLLLICRKSFTEVIFHTSNEEKEKSVEKNEFPCDAKRHEKKRVQMKCIGIVRFMGEMFKLKVLTERIILDCIVKLLMPGDEIRLECLCHLLSSVGEILDAKGKIDQYFQQIRTIVSERKVSSRCNFMLQDVIQLRENSWIPYRPLNIPKKIAEIHKEAEEQAEALAEAEIELNSHTSQLNDVDPMNDHLTTNNWKPRRDENNPKTIDQIHKDAKREAVEQNMLTALHMSQQPQHHQSRHNRSAGHGGCPRSQAGGSMKEGWNTVSSKAIRNIDRNIDVSKLRIEKNSDENIQLGPARSFGGWGRKSSGGGSRAFKEGEKPNEPGNRFSDLSKEDDQRSGAFGRGVSPARGDRMRGNQPGGGFNRDGKNLEFTVGPDLAPSTPTSKVSIEWISQNLTKLLTDPKCDNEKAFDWIEANIPDEITKENKFIRALMSSVCSSAIIGSGNNPRVDPEVIKKWRSLLLKYLDHSAVFELQALYALQALVNSLGHPSGVLRSFFDFLYDEEIISEDAFNQWETSKEEPEGKGVALKQVVQFFAWLREGEEADS